MSNVKASERHETKLTVIIKSIDLQKKITKFVFSKKKFPLRYRSILGKNLINIFDEYMFHLQSGARIFPNTEFLYQEKVIELNKALACLSNFEIQLVRLPEVIPSITNEKLRQYYELYDEIFKLCDGLRTNTQKTGIRLSKKNPSAMKSNIDSSGQYVSQFKNN